MKCGHGLQKNKYKSNPPNAGWPYAIGTGDYDEMPKGYKMYVGDIPVP